MEWLLMVLAVICAAVFIVRSRASSSAKPSSPSARHASCHSAAQGSGNTDLEAETARMLRRVDEEAAAMMPDIEAETAKLDDDAAAHVFRVNLPADSIAQAPSQPVEPTLPKARGANGGPSWMGAEDWEGRLVAYRKQGRSAAEIAEVAAHLERLGPRERTRPVGAPVPRHADGSVTGGGHQGMVWREDYVAKEDEARYLTRDVDGSISACLVDAGDRLAVWSPLDGGALINPKGPGLRKLGLYSSSVRGSTYHRSAYRAANLRKGTWVDLVREPDNAHDANAVKICAAGSTTPVGYVQRGRASAVAKRLDAGEDIAGICLRGPGRGTDNGTAWLLIGSRADLVAMLKN